MMTTEPTRSRRRSHLFIILALIAANASAADLYRWSDEKGDVHYTDRIPPEYVQHGYQIISEQGLTVHTIRPSSEERLSTEKDRRSREEIIYDQRLLTMYGNDDEIITTRDRKLADIETVISLTHETILLLENQFQQLTREAADYEKQSQPIPDPLQQKIAVTQEKIGKYQNSISQRQQEQQKLQQRFDNDLARFREIKQALTQ